MTKFSRFLTALAGVAAVWLVVAAGAPVMAQTADGLTPSDETICDGQVGKAFGFCNAYCEAMDCDSDEANASDEACLKVKDKFIEATEGRELPCESSSDPVTESCPCGVFTDGSLASLGLSEALTVIRVKLVCGNTSTEAERTACVAKFKCTYRTLPDGVSRIITLWSHPIPPGTEEWRWYTEVSLIVGASSCRATAEHTSDAFGSTIALDQYRSTSSNLAPVWFQLLAEFTDEERTACSSAIPVITQQIAANFGALLGTDGYTCDPE